MKRLILALLAVGTITSAQAQRPGSIFVYGDAGVSTSKTVDDDGLVGSRDNTVKDVNWRFKPGLGFQLNKHIGIGINFGIGGNTHTTDIFDFTTGASTETVTHSTDLMVGPFLRYTQPLSRTFFFYDQFEVNYMHSKFTIENPAPASDIEESGNGFGFSMTPAIGINVSHCTALTFNIGGVGYNTMTVDHDGPSSTRTNDFNVDFGKAFNIGVQFNFGGYRHRGHGEPGMDHRRMDTSDDDDMPKRKKSHDEEDEE